MDTLAARLREAFLGTETGEAVPFDELKDAVKDRWQRVADAAAIRVPFSDAQIERMARAARETLLPDEPEDGAYWPHWLAAVRAALAAGGLEPCAVPEYAPDDVALAPTGHVLRDRLVEAEAKIERQRKNLRQLYEARARDARLIAELRAEVDEDNAAAASVNDLLVQVQNLTAERDAQEIELTDLRFYQREFAAVSSERDALRERASVPVKVRWDVTAEEAARMMQNIKCGLASNAERIYSNWDDLGENYKEDFTKTFELLLQRLAAHSVIDAPAGVASIDPTADQVEALARVLRDAYMKECYVEPSDCQPNKGYLAEARAAIAHLAKRPEGLPTAEELLDRWAEFSVSEDTKEQFYLAALRPWLRDPVGWELDVGPIAMLKAFNAAPKGGVHRNVDDVEGMKAALDLCRKRIRPVYECGECAAREEAMMHPQPEIHCAGCVEWERKYRDMMRWHDDLDAKLCAVRAALEGE